jgi:hypothetical protein
MGLYLEEVKGVFERFLEDSGSTGLNASLFKVQMHYT